MYKKDKVLTTGILHGVNIFSAFMAMEVGFNLKNHNNISYEEEVKALWRDVYLQSKIFSNIYLLHIV